MKTWRRPPRKKHWCRPFYYNGCIGGAMKAARIVFPGFWFARSQFADAKKQAARGVGGFCVYGGTAEQVKRFSEMVREASPYDHLLICADIEEDLSETVPDAPVLPTNAQLGAAQDTEGAYRKGLVSARMARSIGIDWLLSPVVDIGYQSPAFCETPMAVAHLAGDYVAGVANGGALNCVKYFPGVSGILKTLAQMEDAEFVPYKHMFRRCDAIMPSDMVFANIDSANRAMMSDKIIKELLKKRLNYKGCVIGAPLYKSRIKQEAAAALRMIECGIEMILAPQNPDAVLDAVEKEFDKGRLVDAVTRSISSQEMLISKVVTSTAYLFDTKEAFEMARNFKKS